MPFISPETTVLPWRSVSESTVEVDPDSELEVRVPANIDLMEINAPSDRLYLALDHREDLDSSAITVSRGEIRRWSLARCGADRPLFVRSKSVSANRFMVRFYRYGSKPSEEYRTKEYETLRREIELRTSEQVTMERQVVIASATVYAVLGTISSYEIAPDVLNVIPYMWWIPVAIIAFGFARWAANAKIIGNIVQYVSSSYPFYGWEVHGVMRNEAMGYMKRYFGPWKIIYYFWCGAVLVSIAVAAFKTAAVSLPVSRASQAVVEWKGTLIDEERGTVVLGEGRCSFSENKDRTECSGIALRDSAWPFIDYPDDSKGEGSLRCLLRAGRMVKSCFGG